MFIGRRTEGPEIVQPAHAWQMPQGGIDEGEDPYGRAARALRGDQCPHVERLGETVGWLTYDLPAHLVGKAWKGKYRGQRQKWFAAALHRRGERDRRRSIRAAAPTGRNSSNGAGSALDRLAEPIVPFKRPVYERIVAEFAPLVAGAP